MEYEITPKSKFSLGIREIWQYRELFYFFSWRDVKVKYKQTIIGFAWVILQPMILMIIFSVSIGKILNLHLTNIPYPLYVYSGLVLWNFFSSGLASAGNSMVSNSAIIKKIYFPRLIIPVSSVLVSLIDFSISLLLLIVLVVYYKTGINPVHLSWCFPASLFIATLATTGLGTWLSALNIKYRDFRYIIPFLLQLMLFISPVIYPITVFKSEAVRSILSINPMYAPIELFRYVFSGGEIEPVYITISTLSAIVFFISGVYYFRKTESFFADIA